MNPGSTPRRGPPGSELGALHARAHGYVLDSLDIRDESEYTRAAKASVERIGRFNPANPYDFQTRLSAQSETVRTVLVRLAQPSEAAHRLGMDKPQHAIVARVNISGIERGRAQSASLGYDAFDPWAGHGLFPGALAMVVGVAFGAPPQGLGLHRLVANVQPHNAASLRVLQRLGFRREGFAERILWVPGPDGSEGWQDHITHALTAQEWQRQPSAAPDW